MIWTDATSYRQGERGNVPQTAWATEINGVRVWVSCKHLNAPGRWVVTCRPLGLECFDLGSADMSSEQARDGALRAVWKKARAIEAEMCSLADAAYAAVD